VWSICAFPITVYLFVFMIHGVINVLIIITIIFLAPRDIGTITRSVCLSVCLWHSSIEAARYSVKRPNHLVVSANWFSHTELVGEFLHGHHGALTTGHDFPPTATDTIIYYAKSYSKYNTQKHQVKN